MAESAAAFPPYACCGRRVGDRGHRTREVAGVADRRHRELDRVFAKRPDDAFEAKP
jgi:hypothetical protein